MTRKKFEGLRLELCRRVYEQQGLKFNPRPLKGLRPDFTKVGSYAEAWEGLKPVRDCVGM